MKNLSVIILSYNTKDLTVQTLDSVKESLSKTPHLSYEIIVIDNGSSDGSVDTLKKYKGIHFIDHKENVGFGSANNIGVKHATGEYILLLNSDTIVDNVNFEKLLGVMKSHETIGLLTVKLLLPDGSIDPASHRGFPTLWRSLTYFSKLEKATASIPLLNRLFGGYHLTHLNREIAHEIDSPSGAFFLIPKNVYDEVKGFDELFFMYGEDLDLAYRIKDLGYKIWYYPDMSIIHIKGQSGRKNTDSTKKSATQKHFVEAMRIFYKKHYEQMYPGMINRMVYWYLDSKV